MEHSQASTAISDARSREVKSLLVSQPMPANGSSPFYDLGKKYGLKVDFRKFIDIQAVSFKEFRKHKISIAEHTAVIFTSRNAVDHFFRMCTEAKLEMTPEMKYFCISDQTAYYLQKYITIRKRKLFVGEKTASDLIKLFKNHKTEKFLYPCSDIRKDDIPTTAKAVLENNLILDIEAPTPNAPSMAGAIEEYVKKVNKS